MKHKKLLTNLLFAAVVLAVAAVLLLVRSAHSSGSKLRAELIYGDNNTTMNLPLEDFYAGARDADFLIYNSTIYGEIQNLDDLFTKSPLLKDFKAVKEGHVWCTSSQTFQQVMGVDSTMEDLIARGATSIDIDKAAKEQGMTTLRKDGWQKALQGITSVEEVLRVTV